MDGKQEVHEMSGCFLNQATGIKRKVLGYLSAFTVSISAALIIVAGQLLGDSVPPFQTNFFRFILQTIIAVFFIIVTKTNPKIPLEWKPCAMMVSSVICTFGAGVLFIVSSWYLPAALVQGLLETVFMTLSGILGMFLKKCTRDLPFSILLCYSGCLLMIQPPGIFPTQENDVVTENCTVKNGYNMTLKDADCTEECCEDSKVTQTLYGVLSVVGLALCLWIHTQFNVEQLNKRMSLLSILFWLGMGCTILSIPVLGILRQPFEIPSSSQIGLELLFGVACTANSFFIMHAVTIIPLSHVAVVLPSALIFLYAFQRTILKDIQPGPANWLAILGLVILFFGTLLSPSFDIIREKKRASADLEEPSQQQT